ncbi:MAG: DUF1287 domain-containing protein [Spirochaetales bacterium]|nr:DUF1287 domain-containing protein [Spirochaetales bacterium]
MKKRINLFLLGLIIGVVLLLIGLLLTYKFSSIRSGFLSPFKAAADSEVVVEPSDKPDIEDIIDEKSGFFIELAKAAEARTREKITYDGSYVSINYPNGDVDPSKGVCTDVIIRTYRVFGIDLQELIHLDMKSNFSKYPNIWGSVSTDTNIDHRRVPNQMTYFKRKDASLPLSDLPADYSPGDIVAWDLGRGLMHIGMVSTRISDRTGNPLIVHNIGGGPKLEDCLFRFEVIGHFRYYEKGETELNSE